MGQSVDIIINNINYELLIEQKLQLIRLANNHNEIVTTALDGVINLIDAIQDAVVADSIKTEEQVFGKLT